MFASLARYNYRLFFAASVVKSIAAWIALMANMWLVLKLSRNATSLGAFWALTFLPLLLLGLWGGTIVDRYERRRILMITQAAGALVQFVSWALVLTGSIRLWMVFTSALVFGVVAAFDLPAGGAFVAELVGEDHVSNAVSLNSAVANSARVVGPALASILIATSGTAWAFFFDGIAFAQVVGALALMRTGEFVTVEKQDRLHSFRKALSYARDIRELRPTAGLLAVTSLLVFYWPIYLSLLSTTSYGGGAGLAGLMMMIFGVGATIGALASARLSWPTTAVILPSAVSLGVALVVLSLLPSETLTLIALAPVGCVAFFFATAASAHILVATKKQFHGRIMGMYGVLTAGIVVVGGPLMSWVSQRAGVHTAIGAAGIGTLIAALALTALRKQGRAPELVEADADDLRRAQLQHLRACSG